MNIYNLPNRQQAKPTFKQLTEATKLLSAQFRVLRLLGYSRVMAATYSNRFTRNATGVDILADCGLDPSQLKND